jgi:hypothetical protein
MRYFLGMKINCPISFQEPKKKPSVIIHIFYRILHLCYIILETKNNLSITYNLKYVRFFHFLVL